MKVTTFCTLTYLLVLVLTFMYIYRVHISSVASTRMTDHSSRSHAIFTISLWTTLEDDNGIKTSKYSKHNFVDLAGSEGVKRSGATGDRLNEGNMINKSLLTLGLVITNLATKPNKYSSYRDSKLTRLLHDSLGGNTKVCLSCYIFFHSLLSYPYIDVLCRHPFSW